MCYPPIEKIITYETLHYFFAYLWCLPVLLVCAILTISFIKQGRSIPGLFWLGVFLLLSGVSLLSHAYVDANNLGF